MKKALSLILALVVCLSLCACNSDSFADDAFMTRYNIIVISCGICSILIIKHFDKKRNRKYREATKDSLQYNKETKTLTVKHRIPLNSKSLKSKLVSYDEQSTSPKELVYTSATSGSVTVGGFNTIGGNAKKKTKWLSTCRLLYCDNEVEKIELFPMILDEARNSNIEAFLEDDTIFIKGDFSDSDWTKILGVENVYGSRSDMFINTYKEFDAKRYRFTDSELKQIIKWLGGVDNPT